MKFKSTFLFALFVTMPFSVHATLRQEALAASPIPAAMQRVAEIAAAAHGNRLKLDVLAEEFRIELAAVNAFLISRPQPYVLEISHADEALHRQIRDYVLLVSKTVFDQQISHNLDTFNNKVTGELLHNLAALAKSELNAPILRQTGDGKLEQEFASRLNGLAKVYSGTTSFKSGDVLSLIVVENNHPFVIPEQRPSGFGRILAWALGRTGNVSTESADAAGAGNVATYLPSNSAHPETDRNGKVTLCGRFLDPYDLF